MKKEDIANKNVTPTTPMTSTTSTGGIVATTLEKGKMTIQDIVKNTGLSGGGNRSRKPMDAPPIEFKGADGSSTTFKKDFTSIDQACKCADKTTGNQVGILKNFNR